MNHSVDGTGKSAVVKLAMGQTAETMGLRITFLGGSTMWYGEGRPPRGLVAFIFQYQGQSESVSIVGEDDWRGAHEVFGFRYRLLDSCQRDIREVSLEVWRSIH